MNEQIKKLAEQAGIYQPDRFDAIDGSNQMEKFAQLIVQECMCISDSIGEHGYIAAEEMGKHFGVEE